MKIKITENTKGAFYMSEMESITATEQSMKENGGITKEDLQGLANFVFDQYGVEVLKSEAEYAKNTHIFEKYGEGTGHCDVWVKITIYNGWNRFCIVGAYLSDIWDIGAVDREELLHRMYIREFKEDQ